MKKVSLIMLAFVILISSAVYAQDTTLFDIRNKIFTTSKEIKDSLKSSKDTVLVNSMWDTCLMTMSRIDAYYQMMRIFNTIKKGDRTEDAVNALISWLNELKRVNETNIKSLGRVSRTIEPRTKIHVKNLKEHFTELGSLLDAEMEKVLVLRVSLEER